MNKAPLNYLQRYVLRHQEANPTASMFNLARFFRLKPGIDLERLADALAKAGAAHQSLKSVLHRYPGGEVVQMQALDDDDIQVEIVRVHEQNLLVRRASYVKTFSMYDQGLVDAIIFDCGKNAYLLSNIHHLVADGYSFPIILEDARRVWNGEQLEEDRYYEMLARREARTRMEVSVAARNLVIEILRSRPFAQLPRYDRSGEPGYGVECRTLTIPDNLETVLETYRVTRHHLFLAATAKALQIVSGENDVAIDWVFHGRLTKEELRTVGAFMVDIPMPLTDLDQRDSAELLYEVKRQTFFGIKNAYAIRDCNDDPSNGERLTFNYQVDWSELMKPGPVSPDSPYAWMIDETLPIRPPFVAAENPFNVNIVAQGSDTVLMLEYDTGRYVPATVKRFADAYVAAIKELTER